jgi:hypothetical protein
MSDRTDKTVVWSQADARCGQAVAAVQQLRSAPFVKVETRYYLGRILRTL